jgi:hypothetical protein
VAAVREQEGSGVRGSLDSILGMATAPDTSQWFLIRDIVRQLQGRNVELITELKTAVRDKSEAQLEAELEKSAHARGRRPEKAAPPGAVEVGSEGPAAAAAATAAAGALGVYRLPSISSKSIQSRLGSVSRRSSPAASAAAPISGLGRGSLLSLTSARGTGAFGDTRPSPPPLFSAAPPIPAATAVASDARDAFSVAGLRDPASTFARGRAVFSPLAADATRPPVGVLVAQPAPPSTLKPAGVAASAPAPSIPAAPPTAAVTTSPVAAPLSTTAPPAPLTAAPVSRGRRASTMSSDSDISSSDESDSSTSM